MRVVKLTWNQKLDSTMNYAIQTEVIVDDDAEAERSGSDAYKFLEAFQAGFLAAGTDGGGAE